MSVSTTPLISADEREVVARIYNFALILREAGVLPDSHVADEYFERPWKWNTEYQLWLQAGSPSPPDFPHFLDAEWFPFVDSLREAGFL